MPALVRKGWWAVPANAIAQSAPGGPELPLTTTPVAAPVQQVNAITTDGEPPGGLGVARN